MRISDWSSDVCSSEALDLPVLVLVLNNAEWGAVRASVKGLYPEGYAANANEMPLTALKPAPDFTHTAAASRAWARRVSATAELERSEEHTSELQSLMRTSYADFCLKKKN